MARSLHLNAIFEAAGTYLGGWRHPDAKADAATDFNYVAAFVQKLEAAKFDALFLADLVGIPPSGHDVLTRVVTVNDSFEPSTLLAALSAVTSDIGLIATASTSYNEPYTIARTFASIDHLSGGRAGWNAVTSLNDGEARNFGLDEHPLHGDRYVRAQEFLEVVEGLWDSFDDDAFTRDKRSGEYFTPSKIRWLNHQGENFQVSGPLNIPRPPQGHPVIAQAGASEDGRNLAARFGEVIFNASNTIEDAREYYADLKRRAEGYGRSPDDILIFPGLSPILGSSQAEADDRADELRSLLHPRVALGDLEYWLGGVDLGQYPIDGPLPELPLTNGSLSTQKRIYDSARRDNLSIRQLASRIGGNDRLFAGTVAAVADRMEEWFTTGAADGFNIGFPYLPGALDDFTSLVVPELQRRGLFRTEYEGTTLRENLGLRRPEVDDRKRSA